MLLSLLHGAEIHHFDLGYMDMDPLRFYRREGLNLSAFVRV